MQVTLQTFFVQGVYTKFSVFLPVDFDYIPHLLFNILLLKQKGSNENKRL